MLTREGFVAADMSGHIVLQRSSWKAEAIRRGDLKISGPIPITEDIPLNPEEEKNFVPKDAHVNSEHSKDELEQQEQNPVLPPHPSQPPPSIPEQASALSSNPVEGQTQTRADFPAIRATMSSPLLRQVEHVQRDSVLQPSANASPTPFRSTPESTTKTSQKRKRKSGLRNVFRKMFGRKSRDEVDGLEEEISNRENSYHPSDTGLAGQSPPREKRVPTGPRISELPMEELQPLHPIGRQLPFPMNVNAPQASPPSEYLHFDRPRRATLPILPGASSQRHSMDDAHGRLTAWEERTEDDGLSSPGIGIALSSPTQATPIRHKRRSRSADALFDIGKERESIDRGQSMELRHWRASYMSGSIYSRPQTAKTVETMRSVQAQEPVIQEQGSGSITGMSATLVTADEPEASELENFREDSQLGAHASVSAFNFGNFQDMSAAEKYGSKIPSNTTSPPRSQEHKPAEDRVQHSEDSYEHLDGSVRRMSVRNNRSTIILENAPKSLRTRNRSTSRSASASRSRSTTLSIHQAPLIQPGGDTANPEVGPLAQSHSVVGGLHSELDDKQVLRTMQEALKHERAARQVLEQQVRNLQRDLSDLHGLVNKLIASASTTSPSYPTPSPDTLIVNSNEDRLMTPRAGHYEHNKGDLRESFSSRFSRSETGSESDYEQQSLKPSTSHDEIQTPDIWATPKEERFGGGFFQSGEERKAFA